MSMLDDAVAGESVEKRDHHHARTKDIRSAENGKADLKPKNSVGVGELAHGDARKPAEEKRAHYHATDDRRAMLRRNYVEDGCVGVNLECAAEHAV